eukprot:scaffold693_cov399-Prasinococcus_capsulatus_cf.AAC.31
MQTGTQHRLVVLHTQGVHATTLEMLHRLGVETIPVSDIPNPQCQTPRKMKVGFPTTGGESIAPFKRARAPLQRRTDM